jgi:transposase
VTNAGKGNDSFIVTISTDRGKGVVRTCAIRRPTQAKRQAGGGNGHSRMYEVTNEGKKIPDGKIYGKDFNPSINIVIDFSNINSSGNFVQVPNYLAKKYFALQNILREYQKKLEIYKKEKEKYDKDKKKYEKKLEEQQKKIRNFNKEHGLDQLA